jgi:hypothetical protein
VWSNHSLAARRWVRDKASSGFSGSSMMIMLAPRPVSIPPTEVASRQPPGRSSRIRARPAAQVRGASGRSAGTSGW